MNEPNPDNSSIPPVERVRQEVDRWLEAVRSTGERTLESLGLSGTNRPATPPIDVIELPEEIVVQIELPGILDRRSNPVTGKTGRPLPAIDPTSRCR
jgi:HSP20 family protein